MTEAKSFVKWPEELTKEQVKDREKHEREVWLNGLWDDFRITRHPAILAAFIRAGGDIGDQKTRELIADLLETVRPKHTRAQPLGQIDFFMATKEMMGKNPTISRNEAFRLLTGKTGAAADELKTEQAQYEAGAKLVGDK